MTRSTADTRDAVCAAILSSAKYRSLAPELVSRVVERELALRVSPGQVEQAARRKLHQVAGAYWARPPRYDRWLDMLESAAPAGNEALRAACLAILSSHASTRERLAVLPELYRTCLAEVAPLHSVLDIACGLNPLASPWMPLARGARYIACDVYTDLAGFLDRALPLLGYAGTGLACDILSRVPSEPVQIALLMKALPCLEQLDADAARALLDTLPARYLLVTFPARSLGGADKGMPRNYEERFLAMTTGRGWRITRWLWPDELVFRIDKG